MENQQRGLRNMTEGSPTGHIFAFALPLFLGSLLQQLYNMVDSWVVGRYVGDAALAAVGIGFPVIFMFTSLFTGMANGGTVVIAQFYGAGRMDRVRDAVDTVYTIFVVSVVPLTALALLLVKPLLWLLRVDPAAYDDAWLYLVIVCAGLVGTIGYNTNAGIMGGLGNSRTTLLFLAVAAVMNIVLDLLLVLRFGMGVAGVAIATIFSQAFSWLFGVVYINRRYPEIAIHPFCFRFDRALFRDVMKIGLPTGLQMSLVSVGVMAVMSKVNVYGKSFMAGYNVGNKLDQLAFLPVQALSNAVTTFVGQNIGAQKPERVRRGVRSSLIMSVAWSCAMIAVLVPLRQELVGFFSPEPEVIRGGALYLAEVLPFFPFFGVMFCLNAAMRGAGEAVFPMADTVLSLILVRVPVCYWLADAFGRDAIYLGVGAGWLIGFLAAVAYYLSGRWRRHGSLAAPGEDADG